MNNTEKQLLNQLSKALFGTLDAAPLSADVLKEAKIQTVSSLLTTDYQIYAKNIRVIAAHAKLTKLLNDIPFTTFKGYASAFYYSTPEKRTMGDVDFIVAPEYYQETVERLLHGGWSRCNTENARHEEFEKDKLIFELHSEIKGIPKKTDNDHLSAESGVRALLADLIDTSVTVCTQQGPVIIPDEFHHGLIMLLHIAGHMLRDEGVGLRHLCDWAVYVQKVDLKKHQDKLEKIGLWTFACQLTAVSSAYLGLPPKDWAGDWPQKFLESLIEDFLMAGNFGQKNAGRDSTLKLAQTSFAQLTKEKVPIILDYPVLLPFAMVFYCLRYMVRLITGRAKFVKVGTFTGAKDRQKLYDQFQLFDT